MPLGWDSQVSRVKGSGELEGGPGVSANKWFPAAELSWPPLPMPTSAPRSKRADLALGYLPSSLPKGETEAGAPS